MRNGGNIGRDGVFSGTVGTLIGGAIVGGFGATASAVAATESLILVNKHVFLPAMEYATKEIWGAFGQDRLKSEQELLYARENYFNPVFNFFDEINNVAKNKLESLTGIDINRDGAIGERQNIQDNGDRGEQQILNVDQSGRFKGSGTKFITGDETSETPTFQKTDIREDARTNLIRSKGYDKELFDILTNMTTGGQTSVG